MAVKVKALSGEALEAALPDLARLRIEVFRAFPYLYDGDEAYEQHYLRSYRDTPDAVLVADASRAQDVKLAVAALKEKSAKQATEFPLDHRPWGWFESLVVGERFQVKRIHVHPGAALSLQSHHHRSEHWIVVEGTAKVTVDDEVRLVTENQSVYIPLGSVHRMENPGKVPMVLIEVQTGSYLGEDDIIRYEDVYARGQGAKG